MKSIPERSLYFYHGAKDLGRSWLSLLYLLTTNLYTEVSDVHRWCGVALNCWPLES